MNVPDNYDKWEQHDAEQQRQLQKLPVCDYCHEPVMDDFLYCINDEIICMDCMNDHFRKDIEGYIE